MKKNAAHKRKQKALKLPQGHCGNPQCKTVWTPRVAAPVKCPRCGSINIYVE